MTKTKRYNAEDRAAHSGTRNRNRQPCKRRQVSQWLITAMWFWFTSVENRHIWFDEQDVDVRWLTGEFNPSLRWWMANQRFGTQNTKEAVEAMWEDYAAFEHNVRAEIAQLEDETLHL